MSFLFEAAESQANKRKSRLLDGGTTLRQVLMSNSNHSTPKVPLIPTNRSENEISGHVSLQEATSHLDLSGIGIDIVWALSFVTLVGPVIAQVSEIVFSESVPKETGFPYHCPLMYTSLFMSLPGMSIQLFCVFLLLSNRCRTGFTLYTGSTVLFVSGVEMQCLYGASVMSFFLINTCTITGCAGQFFLLREIIGANAVHFSVYIWHAITLLFVFLGMCLCLISEESSHNNIVGNFLVAFACVMWWLSTHLSILPVRIAHAQLYKPS